jgi:aryl-alcohol dehydrogenase-like predicted oxidoreductase
MGDNTSLGSSEERYGSVLSEFRDKVIISTKIEGRDPEEAKRDLEASLKKLKTDHVDILLLHSIEPSDEVVKIENGIYREMVRMKESGLARFIGFSSMDSAERSRDLLEALDFDAVILAMNATKYGDYAKVALPVAQRKNVGVIAMKVMRNLVGKGATAKELFEYAWTQEGVASTVVAHYGKDPLEENIAIAMSYGAGKTAMLDREELELRLAEYAGPHALVWARPGYRDGGLIV